MKIDLHSAIGQSSDPASVRKSNPQSAPASKGNAPDVADFSNTRRMHELTGIINALPEIRRAKVESLTASIQNGTYSCTPEQSADALLSHMITG
ncbi:MAG TPA: flagellar biosynthesis anti-sigma factor FlgM [Terriglobales bacterium]|nr:flagellar biosynthesis anti-sigma factor FlgM [Terriglobales bacterium]